MGAFGSKNVKKADPRSNAGEDESREAILSSKKTKLHGVYVLTRSGSMFFDEDGDLAHEFYVEIPGSGKGEKACMRQILDNLTPQGDVLYEIPRLDFNLPMILYHL